LKEYKYGLYSWATVAPRSRARTLQPIKKKQVTEMTK